MQNKNAPTIAEIRTHGQLVFAGLFAGLALFLVLSYPGQTTWLAKTKWAGQPGLWPAVGAGGMLLFALLHMVRLRPMRVRAADRAESRRWLCDFEYALWFLIYVWAVPRIGYIFASLIFVPLLSWRLGYRSVLVLILSAGFAVAVVLLFKGVLDVKIPGGALYDSFPDAIRTFFILNL